MGQVEYLIVKQLKRRKECCTQHTNIGYNNCVLFSEEYGEFCCLTWLTYPNMKHMCYHLNSGFPGLTSYRAINDCQCRKITSNIYGNFWYRKTILLFRQKHFSFKRLNLCQPMLCISAAYAVMRCLSVCVCLSVTFVNCVKTNKHIFIFFHHLVAKPF